MYERYYLLKTGIVMLIRSIEVGDDKIYQYLIDYYGLNHPNRIREMLIHSDWIVHIDINGQEKYILSDRARVFLHNNHYLTKFHEYRYDIRLMDYLNEFYKKKQLNDINSHTFLETLLLNKLIINYEDLVDRHFAYIELQKFYYKHRNLDEDYVDKCVYYCKQDINSLSQLQIYYAERELKRFSKISFIYSEEEKQERIEHLKIFRARIPAFERLAIINEKREDFSQAISICDEAIKYYTECNLVSEVDNFERRKTRLMKKYSKTG